VIDPHCPHRGAPLFFGRNEESGIRCLYHGWKFDVDGACVDMPNVPNGDIMKNVCEPSPTRRSSKPAWCGPTWARGAQAATAQFCFLRLARRELLRHQVRTRVQLAAGARGRLRLYPRHVRALGQARRPVAVHALGDRIPRTLPGYDTPIGHMHITARWLGDVRCGFQVPRSSSLYVSAGYRQRQRPCSPPTFAFPSMTRTSGIFGCVTRSDVPLRSVSCSNSDERIRL